uniref:Uncharacterized protein n=1 Tax=Oryza meridionalis TaxID=40149 RepID=A0A0E0FB54_9ORYZ
MVKDEDEDEMERRECTKEEKEPKLRELKHLSATADCDDATKRRVEAAEATTRNTVSHPGCPTLEMKRMKRSEPHLD